MTTLMDDLKSLYNDLTTFNEGTILNQFPLPIKVQFNKERNALFFEQRGKSILSHVPVYYSLGLREDLENPTWLLPQDYDRLMASLYHVIMDGNGYLLRDRTCLSPENYGFSIYSQDPHEPWKGPELISTIRFISGNNWLWKKWICRKYKIKLVNNFKQEKNNE